MTMKIYKIDIGETLTIAAEDKYQVIGLAVAYVLQSCGIEHLGAVMADGYLDAGRIGQIEELEDDYVVKMVHPSEMTATVEWLKSLITTPQVIGSSEY